MLYLYEYGRWVRVAIQLQPSISSSHDSSWIKNHDDGGNMLHIADCESIKNKAEVAFNGLWCFPQS